MSLTGCLPGLARALDGDALDPAVLPGFVAEQRRRGLVQGTRPLCNVLSPLTLSAGLYRRITHAAALVAGAIERVVSRALVDPALARALGASPRERALAAIDPCLPWTVGVGRLDMVFTAAASDPDPGFAFVELNADSPAGIADQMLLEQTLFRLPALRPHLGAVRAVPANAAEGLVTALRESFRQRGGAGAPRVAIIDWRHVDTAAEQRVLRQLLEERGMPAVLADPDDLRFTGGRLWAQGMPAPVDVVYRRVMTAELLGRADDDHPLLQAYRAGAVCVVNPLRSLLANKKAVFAVLTDPAWAHLFDAAQRAAIRQHVPGTRVLGGGATSAELLRRQHDLVIKPNDGYGGNGVVLGWTVSPAQWQDAIERGSVAGAVVQERLHPRRLRFPTFALSGGGVRWQELTLDCDPFLFQGRVEGAMVRLSAAPLSNVSAGGGVTALLVVEDEPAAEVAAHV
jgi:uncharacterized circularly permuted ATP-grasp superfamily protein